MSITSITTSRQSATLIQVTVTSSEASPTYYWYQDGVLIETGSRPWRDFSLTAGEAVGVDVFDESTSSPETAYPGRVYLAWPEQTDATSYRVDQYIGAEWVEQKTVQASNLSAYRWLSDPLADVTSHSFRVTAIGINEGTPKELSVFMVRRPDPPAVGYSYDSGTGVLTVAAA